MSLSVNIRELAEMPLHLEGELSVEKLDIQSDDDLLHIRLPLKYDLNVKMAETGVEVSGDLELKLNCECARCLKPFVATVNLTDWTCLLPLEGDDKVTVCNDCVDLTPFVREDILLAFPQRPLCETECSGLPQAPQKSSENGASQTGKAPSAWTELDKLKF